MRRQYVQSSRDVRRLFWWPRTYPRVLRHASLEEVGLALQRNQVHKIERIRGVVMFGVAKCKKQAIGNKFDILAHKRGIHANETNRKGICSGLGN